MTVLVPGELIVHKSGHDDFMAVGEGLVEITNERLSIVTNMAVAVDKIDEAATEEARQRAAARLREKLFFRRSCGRERIFKLARSHSYTSSDGIAETGWRGVRYRS